jgi:hypothetical protein
MVRTMKRGLVKMSKLSVQKRKPKMAAVAEARAILCASPLDIGRGESKGVYLTRRARELGISNSLARRIYYCLVNRMDADTLATMRELQDGAEKRWGELHALEACIAEYRSAQGSGDPGAGREGTADRGGRGAGEGEGGVRAGQHAAAAGAHRKHWR